MVQRAANAMPSRTATKRLSPQLPDSYVPHRLHQLAALAQRSPRQQKPRRRPSERHKRRWHASLHCLPLSAAQLIMQQAVTTRPGRLQPATAAATATVVGSSTDDGAQNDLPAATPVTQRARHPPNTGHHRPSARSTYVTARTRFVGPITLPARSSHTPSSWHTCRLRPLPLLLHRCSLPSSHFVHATSTRRASAKASAFNIRRPTACTDEEVRRRAFVSSSTMHNAIRQ